MVIYAYKLYSKKPPFHAWFCRVVISKFFQNNLMVTVIYFFHISDLFLFLSLPVWILILMRRKIICFPLKFKHQGKFEIKLFLEPCRTIAAKVHLKELFICKNLLHAGNQHPKIEDSELVLLVEAWRKFHHLFYRYCRKKAISFQFIHHSRCVNSLKVGLYCCC